MILWQLRVTANARVIVLRNFVGVRFCRRFPPANQRVLPARNCEISATAYITRRHVRPWPVAVRTFQSNRLYVLVWHWAWLAAQTDRRCQTDAWDLPPVTSSHVCATHHNGRCSCTLFPVIGHRPSDHGLTLSPPIALRLYTLPYWSNPPFLIFDIRALWRSVLSARAPECQKLKMAGLD